MSWSHILSPSLPSFQPIAVSGFQSSIDHWPVVCRFVFVDSWGNLQLNLYYCFAIAFLFRRCILDRQPKHKCSFLCFQGSQLVPPLARAVRVHARLSQRGSASPARAPTHSAPHLRSRPPSLQENRIYYASKSRADLVVRRNPGKSCSNLNQQGLLLPLQIRPPSAVPLPLAFRR